MVKVKEKPRELSFEKSLLQDLNPKQREAVIHDKGPLLIIAGAGTGKTMVITRRIAYLVVTKRAEPEEILALTFTDKAADEMEERVDLLVPYGFINAEISTFHAFGDKILRDHAIDIGLTPDYKVMTAPEQIMFFREHLSKFPLEYYKPLSDPTRHISAVVSFFSRLRDEDISPKEYLAYAEKISEKAASPEEKEEARRHLELAKTYKRYQELKMKKGVVDFGDQVTLTLNLLRNRPSILKRLQGKFKYILVDEFQDTNYAQFELVKLLASVHNNITVVGDDDQSIYKFRGAAISNILGFSSYYKDAKKVVLAQNYRSTQEILDTAYRLIRFNDPERLEIKENVDKRLKGLEPQGQPVAHKHYDTVSTEADEVAKLITEKVESGGYTYKDIAVLVRANADAEPFMKALNFRGIPYHFSGSRGLYFREEVRMAIAFLRVIANFEDSVSLFYLSRSDIYQIDEIDLQKINTYAKNRNRTLHHVFEHLGEIPEVEDISPETKATIDKIVSDVKKYTKMAQEQTTGRVLYQFLKDSGYVARLAKIESLEVEEKAKNLSNFFYKVREFEMIAEHDRVNQFVAHLDMLIAAGDDPATAEADFDADAVNILTVHKAKGLEFPVVFMVSLVSDKFPSRKRKGFIEVPDQLIKEEIPAGDFHLQEERRLFYVGMTRAKKELYFSSARDYGARREKKVSQFVLEALDMPKADAKAFKASALEAIELFAPPPKGHMLSERIIPEDEILNLSYYQVNDYLTCPLKYKYIHILKVPIMQHHTVVYGAALHKAVQFYHLQKLHGRPVTAEDLIRVYEENWSGEGFIDRDHEERRFAKGREALKAFFKREGASGIVPTFIEREFGFIKGNNRIRGRWDRVDVIDGEVIVIDYKSSEVKDQKDADKKAKGSLQLQIYAIAYNDMEGKLPDRVELRFLESGLTGTAKPGPKELEKTLDKISQSAHGIRNAEYQAKPEYNTCRFCAYSEVCPSTAYKAR